MFPNSTTLVLAGSWKSGPGHNRMNNPTATTIGPQSTNIFKSGFPSQILFSQFKSCSKHKGENSLEYLQKRRDFLRKKDKGEEGKRTKECKNEKIDNQERCKVF